MACVVYVDIRGLWRFIFIHTAKSNIIINSNRDAVKDTGHIACFASERQILLTTLWCGCLGSTASPEGQTLAESHTPLHPSLVLLCPTPWSDTYMQFRTLKQKTIWCPSHSLLSRTTALIFAFLLWFFLVITAWNKGPPWCWCIKMAAQLQLPVLYYNIIQLQLQDWLMINGANIQLRLVCSLKQFIICKSLTNRRLSW